MTVQGMALCIDVLVHESLKLEDCSEVLFCYCFGLMECQTDVSCHMARLPWRSSVICLLVCGCSLVAFSHNLIFLVGHSVIIVPLMVRYFYLLKFLFVSVGGGRRENHLASLLQFSSRKAARVPRSSEGCSGVLRHMTA